MFAIRVRPLSGQAHHPVPRWGWKREEPASGPTKKRNATGELYDFSLWKLENLLHSTWVYIYLGPFYKILKRFNSNLYFIHDSSYVLKLCLLAICLLYQKPIVCFSDLLHVFFCLKVVEEKGEGEASPEKKGKGQQSETEAKEKEAAVVEVTPCRRGIETSNLVCELP